MTLTLPTIAPVQFGLTVAAFNKAPALRMNSPIAVQTSVVVPAATVYTTALIGIVPFQKGARILYKGSELYIPDWDTSTNVTFDCGYTYYDSTQGTSDPNAFIAASTIGQAAGFASFNAQAGYQFIAEADGWVTITLGGGNTTTEGTVQSEILISYDSSPTYS